MQQERSGACPFGYGEQVARLPKWHLSESIVNWRGSFEVHQRRLHSAQGPSGKTDEEIASFSSTARNLISSEHIPHGLSLSQPSCLVREELKHLPASSKQCHRVTQDGSKGVGIVASFKAVMRTGLLAQTVS